MTFCLHCLSRVVQDPLELISAARQFLLGAIPHCPAQSLGNIQPVGAVLSLFCQCELGVLLQPPRALIPYLCQTPSSLTHLGMPVLL